MSGIVIGKLLSTPQNPLSAVAAGLQPAQGFSFSYNVYSQQYSLAQAEDLRLQQKGGSSISLESLKPQPAAAAAIIAAAFTFAR